MAETTDFPDVSFWQKKINFDLMCSKTEYIILRAGQGNWNDSEFERNRSECQRVGLAWGIYWYYDDNYSPGAQADALYRLFSAGQPRPAEIWCDWESNYGGPHTGIKEVVSFMQRVQELMQFTVGMYTRTEWFQSNTNEITHASQYEYLKTCPLWLAHYGVTLPQVKPPKPWTDFNIWQYGTPAIGYEYGVETREIDMNQRVKGENPEFIDDGEEVPMTTEYRMTTIGDGTRIREEHNTYAPIVKSVNREISMQGTEKWVAPANGDNVKAGDIWIFVTKQASQPLPTNEQGWMAYTHLGKAYCKNLTEIQVPDPTPEPPDPTNPKVSFSYQVDSLGNVTDLVVNGVPMAPAP